MKIGVTERGDAGIDFTWVNKLKNRTVDGAILITKNVNNTFIKNVMDLYKNGFTQIIVHCTCTGHGRTIIEPNVPDYKTTLSQLKKLIDNGFPKTQCVLRIDPIIPTPDGIKKMTDVIEEAYAIGLLPDLRIRISIMDEYKHVKERFKQVGIGPLYGDKFYAPFSMINNLKATLDKYDLQFECCAEPYVSNKNQFIHIGCVSERDLQIMELNYEKTLSIHRTEKDAYVSAAKQNFLNYDRDVPISVYIASGKTNDKKTVLNTL